MQAEEAVVEGSLVEGTVGWKNKWKSGSRRICGGRQS